MGIVSDNISFWGGLIFGVSLAAQLGAMVTSDGLSLAFKVIVLIKATVGWWRIAEAAEEVYLNVEWILSYCGMDLHLTSPQPVWYFASGVSKLCISKTCKTLSWDTTVDSTHTNPI